MIFNSHNNDILNFKVSKYKILPLIDTIKSYIYSIKVMLRQYMAQKMHVEVPLTERSTNNNVWRSHGQRR